MLKVDDDFKDFTLKNHEEKEFSLSEFIGKWIVLYFYPKDDTPGCTTEACDFSNGIKAFDRLNAQVIGVSPDTPASHKKFIEKFSLKILLLSDVEHGVIEKYDSWKLKKMYGKEYMGVSRSTFIINPEGKIKAIWHEVSANGHAKEIEEKLKEIQ
jgi:thioredoxin-dependent peroxiredoxin